MSLKGERELVGATPHPVASALQSVLCADDFPLQIRANHGGGLFPSLFGAESVLSGNNMPWSRPIGGVDAAWALPDRGMPPLRSELLERTIETMAFYREKLARYPKCSQAIHVTQPNLMGPFEAAISLFGSDLLLAAHDEPEKLSALLNALADTYVEACRLITPHTTEQAGDDFIYLHWQICRGTCLIRDDSAILLSPGLYEEFLRPTNERVFRQLGGGAVHWCGYADHLLEPLFATQGLECLDFGEPHLNDMAMWYGRAREEGVAIMRVTVDKGTLLNGGFRHTWPTGVSLLANVADVAEGRLVMDAVRRVGES